LFRDAFTRHFAAIHTEQTARLDQLAGGTGRPDVRLIIEAFSTPAYAALAGPREEQLGYLVDCRAMTDAAPEARVLVEEQVSPMRDRLVGLLRKAMPNADANELFMALSAIFGAYVYPQLFRARARNIARIEFGGD